MFFCLFFHLFSSRAVQIYAAKQTYPTNTDVTFLAVAEETPAEFLWHFGDSSSARTTSRSITKRYNKAGRYRTKTALWKPAVSVNSHHLKSVNCSIFPHQDVSFLFDAGMMSLWSCFGAGCPSPLMCSRCCFRERWNSTGCSISRPCCSTKLSRWLVGSLPAPTSASCGALETDLPGLETAPNTTPSTSELIFKVAKLTFLWSSLVYFLSLEKKRKTITKTMSLLCWPASVYTDGAPGGRSIKTTAQTGYSICNGNQKLQNRSVIVR